MRASSGIRRSPARMQAIGSRRAALTVAAPAAWRGDGIAGVGAAPHLSDADQPWWRGDAHARDGSGRDRGHWRARMIKARLVKTR
jgi:hypothetical protein